MDLISEPDLTAQKARRQKIISFSELSALRSRCNSSGKKLVHCHGVFDLIHAGHLAYFESAKKAGDILVVTITSDEFVNKGPGRPYFNTNVRANMLAALEIIDFVGISHYPTAVNVIKALKPDFYVKGPDYRNKDLDPTKGIFAEEHAVESSGGKLIFTDGATNSSSTLLNNFFKIWTDEQQAAIERVKKAGGLSAVEEILEKISKEKVLIVGEPIIDTYVFCVPESISSKSPSISAKYMYEEDYAGGSLAIANHLSDFVESVTLCTTHGDDSEFKNIVSTKLDKRIKLVSEVIPNSPTPRKTRFITSDLLQRIFEVTRLRSDQWLLHSPAKFSNILKEAHRNATTTIVADFGHGLIENQVLQTVGELDGFIGLNVQTNSSNLGFNPFTKHKKFSYLSIDTKEARLAYHDRYTEPLDLAQKICSDLSRYGAASSMTLGPNGSIFFLPGQQTGFLAPAFTDKVIDPTGAGDAYFAITSAMVKCGCSTELVPFLGNVFAGIKTKVVGNKHSVTKAQLIKAVTAILK